MTHSPYDRLLVDIRTTDDLRMVAAEIDMLLTDLYKADANVFQTTLSTKVQRTLSDSILLSLQEQNIPLTDQTKLAEFFSGLKKYLLSLPLLQLTIAYSPTNEQIERLSDWARQQTNKPVILEIAINHHLLGGALITYNGKYTDLSLKKRLEAVYETKKEEVLGILQ